MNESSSLSERATTSKQALVSIIVARAANGVIGDKGQLPWHLSSDLKRFKALTMGHPIIMGRKTWESIGRPLPGRHNIVVTRQCDFTAPSATVVNSLDAALEACASEDEVFVIGGAQLYAQALPIAQRLYLTEIAKEYAGDTVFPEHDVALWHETSRVGVSDDASGIPFSYVRLDRLARRTR